MLANGVFTAGASSSYKVSKSNIDSEQNSKLIFRPPARLNLWIVSSNEKVLVATTLKATTFSNLQLLSISSHHIEKSNFGRWRGRILVFDFWY